MITIIVAFDDLLNIGKNNSIPWSIPEDLANFKKITTNNICVMGKNTWESLPIKFRPLPNRMNIVVSSSYYKNPDKFSNTLYHMPDNTSVLAVSNLEDGLIYCKKYEKDKEIFIIGGSKVYAESLSKNYVDRMIITKVKGNYDGDTKFPNIDWDKWNSTLLSSNDNFDILEYIKK